MRIHFPEIVHHWLISEVDVDWITSSQNRYIFPRCYISKGISLGRIRFCALILYFVKK